MKKEFDKNKFQKKLLFLILFSYFIGALGIASLICAFTVSGGFSKEKYKEYQKRNDPKDYYDTYYAKIDLIQYEITFKEDYCIFVTTNGLSSKSNTYSYEYLTPKQTKKMIPDNPYPENPAIIVYYYGISSDEALFLYVLDNEPYKFIMGESSNILTTQEIDYFDDMEDPQNYYGNYVCDEYNYIIFKENHKAVFSNGGLEQEYQYGYMSSNWLKQQLGLEKKDSLVLFRQEKYYVVDIVSSSTVKIGDIKYNKKSYSVFYGLDGGVNNENNITTINSGENFTLYDPVRPGYIFDGWYENESLTIKAKKAYYSCNQNFTFYAKWTPVKYLVKFNLKGGSSIDNLEYYVNFGEVLTGPEVHYDGCKIFGWKYKNEIIKNGDLFNIFEDESIIELDAICECDTFYINYILDDQIIESVPIKYNESFNIKMINIEDKYAVYSWESGDNIYVLNETYYFEYLENLDLKLNDKLYIGTDFEFKLLENNKAEVKRYWGNESKIVIPNLAFVKEKIVEINSIGRHAFYDCRSLTSVVIPEGVTSIKDEAFRGCRNLASITLPSTLTSIENNAFDCPKLVEIYNLSNLDIVKGSNDYDGIGYYAKAIHTSLEEESILVEDNNGYIFYKENDKYYLISYKGNDKDLVLPETINGNTYYIESSAFYGCSSLTSIELPSTLTSIGERAFSGCNNLTSIVIPEGVEKIGKYTFEGCSNLTSIELPSTLTSIGERAFFGCSNLTSIEIPEGVTSIGERAFCNCSSLTSIELPSTLTDYFGYIFGAYSYEDNKNSVPQKLKEVTITRDNYIGDYEFYGCSNLTSIELPSTLTSIGREAFYECSSLTSINIPDSVTRIEYGAFWGCTILTSVVIPAGVTSIKDDAFRRCSSLTSINIPDSVTSIGDCAFYGCSSLTSIELPSTLTSIGEYAFYYCSKLTSIELPSTLTSIGSCAFENCINLTGIVIPEGVTSIKDSAFYNCSSLTSIIIPEGVTRIGEYAFYKCSKLTSIELPSTLTSIRSYAFENCINLTGIVIPEGVTSIESCAFRGCVNLTSVELPSALTNIGISAFYNCSSLTSIELPSTLTSIETYAFYNCNKLLKVYNLSNLNITKGSTSYGYVGYYATNIYKKAK